MAIKFNQAKGEAQKNKIDSYQYVEGDNVVRMVGDILPRYVYWLKGENGKNLPFECLSFDRNQEAFNNLEKDWVREYHPELKCGWAYAIQCIHEGKGSRVSEINGTLARGVSSQAEQATDDALWSRRS